MPPTMHDVARRAGVSQSTVSRVLNQDRNDASISQETITRVLSAAKELGYRIDPLARAMKGKPTGVIGIIVRRLDSFLPLVVSALSDSLRRAGYTTINGEAGNNVAETLRLHTLFETQFCDGLVLAADPRGLDEDQARLIFGARALVMTAWGVPMPGIPLVNTDNQVGAQLAMQHLIDLGHRRIAFLDVGWSGDHLLRRQAYEAAMQAHSFPYDHFLVVSDEGMEAGYRATHELLTLDEPPTAIFASEDLLAIGAMRAARERGLRIPDQLSIIGFDGLPVTRFTTPRLTTIRQPVEETARRITNLLNGLISGALMVTPEMEIDLVAPEFWPGESTAPPDC
jgi:DNA-binding LacI/PurR family transcriptional regulator